MNGQERTLDEELRERALEAQRHPPRSLKRRAALTKLMEGIWRSGRIARPYKHQYPDFYEDIHAEAIQKTALHICDKIDSYNPERGPVMRWFNYFLETRFFREAIPEIVGTPNVFFNDSMDGFSSQENTPLPSEKLRKYIEEDPEGILKDLKIKIYPEINFHCLVSRRMAGETFKDISISLGGIPLSTLSDFYQRCLKKVAPQIKRYLEG